MGPPDHFTAHPVTYPSERELDAQRMIDHQNYLAALGRIYERTQAMFGYDPEVPAGFQDADIEQYEMEQIGNRIAALNRAGKCTHESRIGLSATGEIFYPVQELLQPGQVACRGCDRIATDEELDREREALIHS